MNTMKPLKAFKFSASATSEQPHILQGLTPKHFLKLKYSEYNNFGLDNLKKTGTYKMNGWVFDFTPYMKKFVVKQYDSWSEMWAMDKTAIRSSSAGHIDQIVEIPRNS